MKGGQEPVCWKCGTPLGDLPLPLSRFAECRNCRAPLHVCRMCRFFDPHAPHQCREPVAEEVRDKDRPNFCGWFQPGAGAGRERGAGAAAARAALEALFGRGPGADGSGGVGGGPAA